MKVEKHNAHGLELVVTLSQEEAAVFVSKLTTTLRLVRDKDVNHAIHLPCLFEDDNNRWEETEFTVVVERDVRKADAAH